MNRLSDIYPRPWFATKWLVVLLVFLLTLLIGIGILGWQYVKARNELHSYKDPQKAAQALGQELTSEVGKILILPTGETPTIATVSDVDKLKSKPFFANAKNGDKVLIYKDAKKAILYRPSSKQIVEIATYSADTEPAPQKR